MSAEVDETAPEVGEMVAPANPPQNWVRDRYSIPNNVASGLPVRRNGL